MTQGIIQSQPEILTGRFFPSACAREPIAIGPAAWMELASGEPLRNLTDWFAGSSIGAAPAFAFANGFPGVETYQTTTATNVAIFNRNPSRVFGVNILADMPNFLSGLPETALVKRLMRKGEKLLSSAARYDAKPLERVLAQRFGDKLIKESPKSVFAFACGVDGGAETATLFGHKDPQIFPDSESVDLHFDNQKLVKHNELQIRDAIILASSFVGFLGYGQHADKTYMDAGTHAISMLGHLMHDLHALAGHGSLAPPAHHGSMFALKRWRTEASKPALLSRLIIHGIGCERNLPFQGVRSGGVASNGMQIVRSTGDLATDMTLAQIRVQFERASQTHLSMPCVRVIDKSLSPVPGETNTFPSINLLDGTPENMIAQSPFIKACVVENRHKSIDEINLRMRTLHQRGQRSAKEVTDTANRLERYRDARAAAELCDTFLVTSNNLPALLESNGFDPKLAATPAKKSTVGWGTLISRSDAARAAMKAMWIS